MPCAHTWLIPGCLVRMPQQVWTVTQQVKYKQKLHWHAKPSLALPVALYVVFRQTDVTGIYEHILLYVIVFE